MMFVSQLRPFAIYDFFENLHNKKHIKTDLTANSPVYWLLSLLAKSYTRHNTETINKWCCTGVVVVLYGKIYNVLRKLLNTQKIKKTPENTGLPGVFKAF